MHAPSMALYLATTGNVEELLAEWRAAHGDFFEFQARHIVCRGVSCRIVYAPMYGIIIVFCITRLD